MVNKDIQQLPRPVIILDVLLKGTLVITATSALINIFFFIKTQYFAQETFYGDSPINVIGFLTVFVILYIFFIKGFYRLVSVLFVSLFIIIGFYSSIKWGADIPFAFIIYALAIVLAGITVSAKFALITNLAIGCGLMTIIFLQANRYISYDESWIYRGIQVTDGFFAGLILTIISLVSWLSNKEIERSFARALASEKALKIERDNLEIRVEERTAELQKTQVEKMVQMYKFAEFGKLASGLIHDLVNPLTSVSINLEQLNEETRENFSKTQLTSVVKRAVEGTKEMENYVAAARKQIQQQEIIKKYSLNQEVQQCIKMFSYRAKCEGVTINFDVAQNIMLYGNLIKMHHVIGNLIANALDAYLDSSKKIKAITIHCSLNNGIVTLKIADNGKGMRSTIIKKIFNPFFTTKKEYGTGIGLSITRDIVTNVLKGNIYAESYPSKGTTFTVTFPHTQAKNGSKT